NRVDMVVLSQALVPSKSTEDLVEKLRVYLSEDGFIAEKHPKLAPVLTHREGIFVAGAASGPKDVRDSVVDAQAAASQAISLFNNERVFIKPRGVVLNENLCDGCKACIHSCPKKAISIENRKISIDRASCNGCGACLVSCEKKALDLAYYGRYQLNEQIRAMLMSKTLDVRIIGFFSDQVAYDALDMVGTSRLYYPESIYAIRVPTTLLVDLERVLFTFAYGADAIVLSEAEGSFEAKTTEESIVGIRKSLEKYGIEKDRLSFQPASLPTFRVIPEKLASYEEKIRRLGKLHEKIREGLKDIVSKKAI
ncbi:MAG: hydrogenase iron-sulfur subunit, partial [Halobacteria archaeon]